jgi:GT2 family glycosyltransferase
MISPPPPFFEIACLITAHNRRELTLSSLRSLFAQQNLNNIQLTVLLVDDGSTDGTAEAVAAEFPAVDILHGDGSLFWNGGMRLAFQKALDRGFDAYLWFNDDSLLYPDALSRIVQCAQTLEQKAPGAVVSGSMMHPDTGLHTYGGHRKRTHGLYLIFDAIVPDEGNPVMCDSVNGNFTLVTRTVAERIGNLDPTFRHQFGDVDYGLRAKASGFAVAVAPGYYGDCRSNSSKATWRDKALPLRKRWKNLMSPKGSPPREWIHYVRRHFGWRWPLYAVSPYLRTLLGRGPSRHSSQKTD